MKKRYLIICLVLVGCLALSPKLADAEKSSKPIWLVVTKPVFIEAIKPLAEYRANDGFEAVISTKSPPEALAELNRQPAFLLLVGDDEPGQEQQPWYLPAKRVKRYRWQQDQQKQFASDVVWADLNGDLLPEIPVGRIPARSVAQVKQIVDKTIAFEQKAPTLDDLRLPAWGGTAAYDPVIDRLASTLMMQIVRTKVPAWLSPWIISADPKSPFCGWPPDQSAMFTQQLKRGGMLAVLIGHGWIQDFYAMKFRGRDLWYNAQSAAGALASGEPGPPLVIICCHAGNFTTNKECLAESLLRMPGGPVAVIAATAESHPLTNYFSSVSLVQALGGPQKRLGQIWLRAQKDAVKARDLLIEPLLCDVEGKLEAKMDVSKLRRDQMLMYSLLGDPAVRLRLPEKLHGKLNRHDDGWHWEVNKPQDATKLYVGLRATGQKLPVVEGELQKDSTERNFQAANEVFIFEPLSGPGANEPWKGVINKEGTLRLVATGPNKIYVAALNLKMPAGQQTTMTTLDLVRE